MARPPNPEAEQRLTPEMRHSVSAIKSILFKGADLAAVKGDIEYLVVYMAITLGADERIL